MDIELYIRSGMIESYALGLATVSERTEFELLMAKYPELRTALSVFEYQLEQFALCHETPPPPGMWEQIEARVRDAQ